MKEPHGPRCVESSGLAGTQSLGRRSNKKSSNCRLCSRTNAGPTRNTKSTEASIAARLKLKYVAASTLSQRFALRDGLGSTKLKAKKLSVAWLVQENGPGRPVS